MQVRELRRQRGWSQEQLAEASGLSVRTVQRIEKGSPPGLASADALARALGVEPAELAPLGDPVEPVREPDDFFSSIRTCLRKYADFQGRAERAEYWWFLLFVVLVASVLTLFSEALGAAALLVLLVPTLAAGARRLHDTGSSGWWQLFALAPFGVVVPLVLMARPTEVHE